MSENYIMLNGKRVDLTEEQLEKLGIKAEKKDCFERLKNNQRYYYICARGEVEPAYDYADEIDDEYYKVGNYCADESLLKQRALHETLNRLLWRFSMQNDGDKIDWQKDEGKACVYYDSVCLSFKTTLHYYCKSQVTYFYTEEIAKRAIYEIVLPFMKEHPEFVW